MSTTQNYEGLQLPSWLAVFVSFALCFLKQTASRSACSGVLACRSRCPMSLPSTIPSPPSSLFTKGRRKTTVRIFLRSVRRPNFLLLQKYLLVSPSSYSSGPRSCYPFAPIAITSQNTVSFFPIHGRAPSHRSLSITGNLTEFRREVFSFGFVEMVRILTDSMIS